MYLPSCATSLFPISNCNGPSVGEPFLVTTQPTPCTLFAGPQCRLLTEVVDAELEEELAEGEQNGVPFWCAYVQVLDGVYLDEVV